MNILDVVIPIFGLILLGWILKHIGLLNQKLVDIINNYVYYIGITVITFLSLHDTSLAELLDPGIYLLNIMPMLAIFAIAYATGKLMKLDKGIFPVFVVCAFFGNTGYIGFPLNIIVQGKDSLHLTAFISTLYMVVAFTLGVYLFSKYSDGNKEAGKLHKNPVLWAAFLGIALSWLAIPQSIRFPLDMISDSISPLALVATGAMIGNISDFKSDVKNIGVLSFIKLVLAPAIVAITGMIIASDNMLYTTSILEAATPIGVTNSVLAAQFNLRKDFASNAIIISTILSVFSLSIILLLI